MEVEEESESEDDNDTDEPRKKKQKTNGGSNNQLSSIMKNNMASSLKLLEPYMNESNDNDALKMAKVNLVDVFVADSAFRNLSFMRQVFEAESFDELAKIKKDYI